MKKFLKRLASYLESPSRTPTGEPDFLFLKHLYAYLFIQQFVHKKIVLDIGCGKGYGSFVLSKKAKETYALDLQKERVIYVHEKYGSKIVFLVADASFLPFKDKEFDIIASLQVIEHVPDLKKYLFEIHRILKEGGKFILTTPNRKIRLKSGEKPWNPDHLREFDFTELHSILKRYFDDVKLYGLHGSSEILTREKNRIHRIRLSLKLFPYKIRHFTPVFVKKLMDKVLSTILNIKQKRVQTSMIRIDDYKIRTSVASCLDFIAICSR